MADTTTSLGGRTPEPDPVSDDEFARRLIHAKRIDLAKLDVAIADTYPDYDGAQVAGFAEWQWEFMASTAGVSSVPGPILRKRLAEWADKRAVPMTEDEVFSFGPKASA